MIGVLCSIFNICAKATGSIIHLEENAKLKKQASDNNKIWYIDRNGALRHKKTNELLSNNVTLNNGDVALVKTSTQEVMINYSESDREKRKKQLERKQMENNHSTVRLDLEQYLGFDKDKYRGIRYKDKATGRIFVIRKVRNEYYYFDTVSNTYVRPTDYQLIRDENIKKISERQYNYILEQRKKIINCSVDLALIKTNCCSEWEERQ